MIDSPTEPIRLTVPITPALSHELSVLAFECDLTRGQLVRRALHAFVAEAKQRHADLLGLSVDDWWQAAVERHAAWERMRPRLVAPACEWGDAPPGR